ncbi:hypothetical protein PQR53_33195 [Paraburkholderia fungorum]|uniref:hypothetical protein n=1 Tax=Paraburkholderia fungorum TaxID=134537 RepID=UPI0038B78C14
MNSRIQDATGMRRKTTSRLPQSQDGAEAELQTTGKTRKQVARKPAELRLRAALNDECKRQRDALSEMEAAAAQIATLDSLLTELLSRAGFVAVLKAAGVTTIPCLTQRSLLEQRPVNRAIPAVSGTTSGRTRGEHAKRIGVPDDGVALFARKMLPARTVQALARMAPSRRSAVIAVMKLVDNFTGDFACALLAATPAGERSCVVQTQRSDILRMRSFARSEKRLIGLHARSQVLCVSHADNLVGLAVCISFVRTWIRSPDVLAWLRVAHPHHLASLERIVGAADAAREPGRPMKLPFSPGRQSVAGKRTMKAPQGAAG